MSIAVYGGSFNPPHIGHRHVVEAVIKHFKPRRFFLIPAGAAPHKSLAEGSPDGKERLELCRLAFEEGDAVTVSDMEILREGKSYTADTLRELMERFPGEELILVMGTDMYLSLESWYNAEFILKSVHICVVRRDEEKLALRKKALEYAKNYRTRSTIVALKPVEAASSDVRTLLPMREGVQLLPDRVYGRIISRRLYGAKPNWNWLREKAYLMLKPKRIPHVKGCEEEAVRLARRWGADTEAAAEAAILHDVTKKLNLREQLILCEKYGIIPDALEAVSEKLLHAKTGAAIARERFGVSDEVYEAIRWHTTGKADMSLLEKIIYMADYIEPTRNFDGVEKLRELAYSDLDAAMKLGYEMSLADLAGYGVPPHPNTLEALKWYERD